MARIALAPALALLGTLAVGCRGEVTAPPDPGDPGPRAPASADGDAPAAPAPSEARPASASLGGGRPAYAPPSSLGAPIATRRATRSRQVYADLSTDAAVRGRIPSQQSFHVYERRAGEGCDRDWAKVGEAAWICLERTEASDEAPIPLPVLEPGAVVPFVYARHPKHEDPQTPPLLVYDNFAAYRAGDDPIEELPAYGSYAFTKLRKHASAPVLVTPGRDVVPLGELELLEPSEFAGRELEREPIADGVILAWGIRWRAPIHPAPDPSTEPVAHVPFHTTLGVSGEGEGKRGPEGERWIEVLAEGGRPGGWIRAEDIRRFLPQPPPEPILAGQITIDVDLDQQILSVWREEVPVFVTLISSGKPNYRTPPGLYRISTKRAYGKMSSDGDARKPYFADAVPWAMYFQGNYALHAAYWHDMFGHRHSHGCVNLSPKDAKRVFELAGPLLPDGWLIVNEHARDPGALVRVREAGEPTPDQRRPLADSAG